MTQWKPFRPSPQEIDQINQDIAGMGDIQEKLKANHPDLKVPDRVAHQYQIAGSKVMLKIESRLPENLAGVGLFEPGSEHIGIARVSTGLGCPHLETDPDFLGLMLAFQTNGGHRVDFLGINDPGSPTDTHNEFVALLEATAESAGTESPFGSGLGELDVLDLTTSNIRVLISLVSSRGLKQGGRIAIHVLSQTFRTAKSTTAYQPYWTGVVEIGGLPGKFIIKPETDENQHRSLTPGERHLTEEWRERQARGAIVFDLQWLPFIDEQVTSLVDLTEGWEERPHSVGRVTFPKSDAETDQARLWAALAAEMGANPGNWIRNRENSIPEPGTEFTCARKFAYQKSQAGRDVLPAGAYAQVFQSGDIGSELAEELNRRRVAKRDLEHIDTSP